MMQTHPIDLIREQLALVSFRFGQGLMGLATALALIGLMWVSSLRPADAAGPQLGPDFSASAPDFSASAPDFSASATVEGHLGVAALRLNGAGLAQAGAVAASASVCRLEIDLQSEAPLAADCDSGPVRTQ